MIMKNKQGFQYKCNKLPRMKFTNSFCLGSFSFNSVFSENMGVSLQIQAFFIF